MQYLDFWAWLILLNTMISQFYQFYPFSCKLYTFFFFFLVSSFFMAQKYSTVWSVCLAICLIYLSQIFFIHELVVGHTGWFHGLGITANRPAIKSVQVSILYVDLQSFKYMPKNSMVGSLSFWQTSILIFIVVAVVYIPVNGVWAFLYSHIFISICCCLFSWWLPFWLGWDRILV
jgi:hypothetical protein